MVATTGDGGTVTFRFVESGTWTIRETGAPAGYALSDEPIDVVVERGEVKVAYDKDDSVWAFIHGLVFGPQTVEGNTVDFEDTKTHVSVSKVDAADGKVLKGARIQVVGPDGEVVDEWDSGEAPHEIEGLRTGVEYTLRETVAPDGYTVAANTTFQIDERGEVTSTGTVTEDGTLLVEDAKTKVSVSKVDAAGRGVLSGATIQVVGPDGEVADEWTSADEPHQIEGLRTGVEYTLRETAAPAGYAVAADIAFTIDTAGNVLTDASTTTDADGNTVILVEDERSVVTRDLVVQKGIDGREWRKNDANEVMEDYTFELYDAGETTAEIDAATAKREQSKVATTAITQGLSHQAKFGTFTFTAADAGQTFSYQVREAIPSDAERVTDADGASGWVKDGIYYNEYMYDVTYTVSIDDDGMLQVDEAYHQGENALDALQILNTYRADETEVAIEAQKVLKGRDIEESDDFQFNLYYVTPTGSEQLEQSVGLTRADDGTYVAQFAPKRYTTRAEEEYIIREAIPEDATETTNEAGETVWEKNGITYDKTSHKVHVSVTDDQQGQLRGAVYYDGSEEAYDATDNAALPVFTNTVFEAKANIEFHKEYFGNDTNARFAFMMMAADDEFNVRPGENGAMSYTEGVVDTGQPFTMVAYNEEFDGVRAEVHMPTISYHKPGTYRYVITETTDDTDTMSADASEILVTVVVDSEAHTNVTYQVRADGATTDVAEGELPTLYNNAMVSLAFRSRALRAQSQMARFTNFEPAVKKVLENGILKGDEFKFAIYAGTSAEGEPMQVVSNDANGTVSFGAIFYDESNIGKTYEYTIVEVPTSDETVVFDEKPIRLTVKVSEGEGGEVVAEGSYSKATDTATYEKTDDPTFVNAYDTIVIHAVKRSREEPYDPLAGAHYGLWMVNPDGKDVYMGLGRNQKEKEGSEEVSSENGDLYYDISLLEGVAYYFLEEWPPPAGHLVDPYPTDYFTLVHDKEKGTFRLVYETDEEFKTYCPEITPRS